MTCASTEPFSECGLTQPDWYKDGAPYYCCPPDCNSTILTQTEERSVLIQDNITHAYYCEIKFGNVSLCKSNDLRVQPLSKLGCMHYSATMALGCACIDTTYGIVHFSFQVSHFAQCYKITHRVLLRSHSHGLMTKHAFQTVLSITLPGGTH